MTYRILVIGAHPDDCEVKAAGSAAKWSAVGHDVTFCSLTDGGAGHHEQTGQALVVRRRTEAEAAAEALGVRPMVMHHPDGTLMPTPENRLAVVRLIRQSAADLVLTHRPNDYHPDHRYASQLVQDAAYMVTVPAVAEDVPHLLRNPVFGYLQDDFTKPCPLDPTVANDVTACLDDAAAALHCHASQFYEWLPYNRGELDAVPRGDADRLAWTRTTHAARTAAVAAAYADRFPGIGHAEVFEISEYGRPLPADMATTLFDRHLPDHHR